jgi:hypothetical protein
MKPFLLFVFIIFTFSGYAATIHVGLGLPIVSISDAADIALPGDTILVHSGSYAGGYFIPNLQGERDRWIYILAAPGETVIYEGGNNAWQFTDAAWLYINGFIFQQQVGNGLNFDDGGTYSTPAHHVIFENCTFRDMNATGNNDLLKLSGVDSFEVRNCVFMNGAEGGSGIDMVGCHDGLIINNHFENLGSNSIQAKGGTSNIRIEGNFFKNGGQRAVNLGGSTGLSFFRPLNADYEAANLKVYANIFIGSVAPVAFVGCINSEVVNNTIYLPEKWVLRILQETVDTTRFKPCGDNAFRNNIIYIDDQVTVECNIGPNTAPETFTFSNNLWFHSENPGWQGPQLPVVDTDHLVGEDPLFQDASSENFDLTETSPAIGEGQDVSDPSLDYEGLPFLTPRSIGAFEGGMPTSIKQVIPADQVLDIYPNPFDDQFTLRFKTISDGTARIIIWSMDGKRIFSTSADVSKGTVLIHQPNLGSGFFLVEVSIHDLRSMSGIIRQ